MPQMRRSLELAPQPVREYGHATLIREHREIKSFAPAARPDAAKEHIREGQQTPMHRRAHVTAPARVTAAGRRRARARALEIDDDQSRRIDRVRGACTSDVTTR